MIEAKIAVVQHVKVGLGELSELTGIEDCSNGSLEELNR
jgi:hypothetical protein